MTVISLTTDFGNLNGFVGTLKGVIWSIAPGAQIADITHDIPPHGCASGRGRAVARGAVFPARLGAYCRG
jgi:Uncharacterized conserved protein